MQQYIAYGLIGAGAVWAVVGFMMKRFYDPNRGRMAWPSDEAAQTDIPRILGTDEAAPAGTADYLKMIQFEAPKATEKEWWVYATQGLSKIAVVRSERDRLGGGPAA